MKIILLVIFISVASSSFGQDDLKCIWDSIPCCPSTKTLTTFPTEVPKTSVESLEKSKKLNIYKAIKFKCENGERYILIYNSAIDSKGYTFIEVKLDGSITYSWYDETNIYKDSF